MAYDTRNGGHPPTGPTYGAGVNATPRNPASPPVTVDPRSPPSPAPVAPLVSRLETFGGGPMTDRTDFPVRWPTDRGVDEFWPPDLSMSRGTKPLT